MRKVFSLVAIGVMFFTPFVVSPVQAAGAARFPLQEGAPPVTVVSHSVKIVNFDPPNVISEEENLTGDGTPVVLYTGRTVQKCREENDEGTDTVFCPAAEQIITIVNDTGAQRLLHYCGKVYTDEGDPAPPSLGAILSHPFNGVRETLPEEHCHTYLINAGDNYTIELDVTKMNSSSDGTEGAPYALNFELVISWEPIDTCDDDFQEVGSSTYDIDPTIETPLGPTGSPADNQIYETESGQYYTLSLSGTWNDGGNGNRKDAAISWDGIAWTELSQVETECIGTNAGGTITYYLIAESVTLYIRANDTPGAFANNTPNPSFTYTIAQVVIITAPCESQFAYDEFNDLVGHTGVSATDEDGVLGNNAGALTVGEWYVVRWTSGYWQDDGTGPDRTDLEYSYNQSTWSDLGNGGNGVWCATEDGSEVLFQATGENIYLRVNNQSGSFASNTGNPFYDVFAATFIRTPTSCETKYDIGDLIAHDVVDADQSGGKRFAFITTRPDSSVWGLPQGLEYGGWYVIDTTDGPWSVFSFDSPDWRYDMAVSTDGGETWEALATWDHPVCNFEIDAVGHRRIVFQMPFTGTVDWLFRVNDTGIFTGNQGSMEWDLYSATALTSEPQNGQCDYSYDQFSGGVSAGVIDANDSDGVPLTGIVAGQMYALRILGSGDYGWKEDILSAERYDAEMRETLLSGWSDLGEDYEGGLCGQVDGEDTTVFFVAGQNFSYAVRVNSTTFEDNTGELGYVVYDAQAGQSVVNTCFDGWSLQELDPFEWLDVRAEQGELLLSDNSRYEESVALVPGRSYAVETPAGQGPWGSFDAIGTERYDVAISNDNGTTWEPVSMENSLIDCASHAPLSNTWKVKFTALDGQIWKIRVNDEAGEFANNTGNMAFKFYVLCEGMACTGSVPNDSTTNPPGTSVQGGGNVCQIAVLRPGPLSAAELFDLGNYLSSWIQYLNLSGLRYLAWCPNHTSLIVTFLNGFKTREPLATLDELNQLLQYAQNELDSYNWGEWDDTSLFSIDGAADVKRLVDDYIIRRDAEVINPWQGNQLLEFGDTSLPPSYTSCNSAFANGLPARLRSAVCFVSAYFKETGAAFWVQLLLIDIPAVGILLAGLKGTVEQIITMVIGVDVFKRHQKIDVIIQQAQDSRRR